MIPLINGEAYSFAQVIVNILGVPLAGVAAIEYEQTQTKENVFGAGPYPVARGRGNIDASGSIEIQMTDVEALRTVAPDNSLVRIPPFDVVVSFLNGTKSTTHILKNCEFTDDGVSGSNDDTVLTRSFGLIMSHVTFKN